MLALGLDLVELLLCGLVLVELRAASVAAKVCIDGSSFQWTPVLNRVGQILSELYRVRSLGLMVKL